MSISELREREITFNKIEAPQKLKGEELDAQREDTGPALRPLDTIHFPVKRSGHSFGL